ncbi:MAG TPA: phytanoyl-CoA dioxygenase family protein [Pirellulales bacterium]|nr:phytanoyl-CoA dioxygenase family protein [Pirellulales bacterium]
MLTKLCLDDPNWLMLASESVKYSGFALVEGVLPASLLTELRAAMYRTQQEIERDMGTERLQRAGEMGVLRLMPRYDPLFFCLLELPAVLAVVDTLLCDTAVMHLMNGFVLPSVPAEATPSVFQNRFHQDFPRVLNGYLASLNVFLAIDEFTEENGATLVVPGTHQRATSPDPRYLEAAAVAVECAAGAMLVFDSTLYHAAGRNTSGRDRLAINLQFTRSYIKQQIDYVRALGPDAVLARPSRTQQLLGWYTRVVTSLDEYYQPEQKRLYRRGQG